MKTKSTLKEKNANDFLTHTKGTKGITLVALVVTIVILLILAGITITMLFSDNGIITKAREAADEVNKSQSDAINGINNLEENIGIALGEAPKTEKGKLVPITTKFAKYTDDTSSDVVPIPGGYGVVGDSKTDVTNKNAIAGGLVISDLEEDTLDNDEVNGKRGNQFVWVPVNDEQLNWMCNVTNKRGNLYDFGSSIFKGSEYVWTAYDEPKIKETTEYREPDIVSKFDGIDATERASYFKEVISETMTGADFKIQLEEEFESMIASVQKYKGFYIGRYETGNVSSTDNTVKPVVQRGATVGGTNWYYQYQESKNIAKENKNVASSMIWGCQFDRTLEWIVETNLKVDGTKDYTMLTDSRNWGNYKDSIGKAATNSGTLQLSGSNEAWKKNNIYDLAGNTFDWTIEARNDYGRAFRRRILY